MIRWHQTHSGVFASVLLALSIGVYYLAVSLPIVIPDAIAVIVYFLPAALLVAVIDHGHATTPWSRRIWRFLASWVMTVVWMVVGLSMVAMLDGGTVSLGQTWADVWETLWPMMVSGFVLALFGLFVIRWMERQTDPFARRPSAAPLTGRIGQATINNGKQVNPPTVR